MDKKQLGIEVLKHSIWSAMILFGTFLMAIGFSVFLAPKNIISGGFSGIAFVLQEALMAIDINVSRGILYVLLNVPLYILAWKNYGKSFLFLALVGTFSFSVFMDIVKLDVAFDDSFLCALYGGIFYGIGLGIIVRANGSTGGTDLLGSMLHKINPKITIGMVIFVVDTLIVVVNVFFNGAMTALYGIVSLFISGIICDYISEGPRSIKAYYVISSKYEEISEAIIFEMHRGATAIDARGMFSQEEKKILLILVSRREVGELNRIVFSIDPSAFTFSTNCKDAVGNGFNKPMKTKKMSEFYKIVNGDSMAKAETINLSKYKSARKCVDKKEDKD